MKVEKKGKEVFEPIVITLETKKEAQYMQTIACIQKNQTLKDCCKIRKEDVDGVDSFGAVLMNGLDDFLDC